MADGPCTDGDVRQSLEVLLAIRVLQRWLVARPLGADGIFVTAASLTFTRDRNQVVSMTIPHP